MDKLTPLTDNNETWTKFFLNSIKDNNNGITDLTDRKIKGRVNVISPTVSTVKRARAKVKKSIKDKKNLTLQYKSGGKGKNSRKQSGGKRKKRQVHSNTQLAKNIFNKNVSARRK